MGVKYTVCHVEKKGKLPQVTYQFHYLLPRNHDIFQPIVPHYFIRRKHKYFTKYTYLQTTTLHCTWFWTWSFWFPINFNLECPHQIQHIVVLFCNFALAIKKICLSSRGKEPSLKFSMFFYWYDLTINTDSPSYKRFKKKASNAFVKVWSSAELNLSWAGPGDLVLKRVLKTGSESRQALMVTTKSYGGYYWTQQIKKTAWKALFFAQGQKNTLTEALCRS